ncbi:acetyl-coenzyme A synthetase N-terminal domain-containing protein [Vulcanisaeta distributa]|uniref:acetyl-coenzyme A synthetase N-terminal domain-containing protein n=1 Tax=Vulcanisaeta distributa TaxID=164451 RepID=UPI000AAD42C0|nr:acetyl-coenzyme A synthetase N-terminal domain-containing protein [Vulcanisaeta distributa]
MALNQKFYSLDKIRRMAIEAAENPAKFWADKADYLTWFERPKSIFEGRAPDVYWFRGGGYLNISYNAIDRHIPLRPIRSRFITRMRGGAIVRSLVIGTFTGR